MELTKKMTLIKKLVIKNGVLERHMKLLWNMKQLPRQKKRQKNFQNKKSVSKLKMLMIMAIPLEKPLKVEILVIFQVG